MLIEKQQITIIVLSIKLNLALELQVLLLGAAAMDTVYFRF